MSGVELVAAGGLWEGSAAITLADAAIAAGSVLTAYSAISGAQAQSSAMKYNAQMAERNALIARQNAAVEEAKQRRLTVLRQGAARANIGMSGVDLEGSPLDILEQNAAQEELDALTIRYKGELVGAGNEADASLYRANASNATSQGYLKAGSAIIMGGARIGDKLIPGKAVSGGGKLATNELGYVNASGVDF